MAMMPLGLGPGPGPMPVNGMMAASPLLTGGVSDPGLGLGVLPPVDLVLIQPPRPRSSLDHWTQRHFKKLADALNERELDDLAAYLLRQMEQDRSYWTPRDERIREDRDTLALKTPQAILGQQNKTAAEHLSDEDEMIILPSPWSFYLNVTNSLAGAGFTVDVPSSDDGLGDTQAAQDVEQLVYALLEEWTRREMERGGTQPLLRLAQDDVMGWICVLTMPNSLDRVFPWDIRLVDPLEVWPKYGTKGLQRVLRHYTLKVEAAQEEFPDAEDLFEGLEDDADVEVLAYYDNIYHAILLVNGTSSQSQRRRFLKPPTPHGAVTLDGEPFVPWTIRKPLGDLSRGMTDSDRSRMDGPGILFGVHDVYRAECKTVSLLMNNVARSENPTTLQILAPGQTTPVEIEFKKASRNVVAYGSDVKILDTAPNPGNLQPLMQILKDEKSKVTLPDVFFGNTMSGISGYAINLLSAAAKHIMLPYIGALESALDGILERMLALYVTISAESTGPLDLPLPQQEMGRTILGHRVSPETIQRVRGRVKVTWGELTPQDEAGVAAYGVQLVGAGVMSRYTLLKKLGIRNPLVEMRRVYNETLLQNPRVAQMVGPVANEESDETFWPKVQSALQIVNAQEQEQQMQPGEAMRQAGTGALPTSVLPLEQQPARAGQAPGEQNPADIARRRQADVMAQLLAQMGGSPPAP